MPAVADLAFKALTAGLGVATIYLAGTFSVNVYRGLSWHSEQSVSETPHPTPPSPQPHSASLLRPRFGISGLLAD
ncbi:hypothetical protein HU200_010878 [Digitaria exilis]|uniref:Uncharacterized protein n=1 Tax=Digitaria exilis TaxID=1010633 RepID=A0A835FIQ7_9POAL|nr:hypothetical protein HU200_010878 [Digitaria exilis]